ncbi:MAG: hypothetical protein NT075_30600, partial [Chloroflexi bacterium]|nr:hypothetical protein [Chloroflexota bacterium]
MSELDTALTGTTYLSPSRYTAFYDHYHKQLLQTLAWLQQATRQAATTRDLERRADQAWLADKRQRLAQLSGFDQALRTAAPVELTPLTDGAVAYQMATDVGVLYTGLRWDPAPDALRGVVILAGHATATTEALITHYQAQGLRVIVPSLARFQHSFAREPVRKGYFFTDDELLNLLFFIVGGSLAGLEAAELLTITRALAQKAGQPLPVALHLAGRHTLTATVAAALAPSVNGAASYTLLVLPEEVGLLDHQADDQRVNTIWNFHTHFDALTLFQMAQGTDLLFVEPAPTPSACYGRAFGWFKTPTAADPSARQVERLVATSPEKLASTVAAQCSTQSSPPVVTAMPAVTLDQTTMDALYQRSFLSKLAHLETLHTAARQGL